MNYDIKIKGDSLDDGTIEFDKLANITKVTKDIAAKALMLKLFGYSDLKVPSNVKNALSIKLEKISGNAKVGTHLLLEASTFNTIDGLQLDFFKPTLLEELSSLTPMSLVITSFSAALSENSEDKNNLDKPLLKSLLQFKKSFTNVNETFLFSNRQSIPQITLHHSDFKRIEQLDESIPDPQKVIITGRVDELKYTKSQLVLITDDGNVHVQVKDSQLMNQMTAFFGKDCTIQGMANYRLGGMLSFIEMQGFGQPDERDKYFSKKPKAMNAIQQVLFQAKQGKKRNPFIDIVGKWPGNETEEEFEEMLKLLD